MNYRGTDNIEIYERKFPKEKIINRFKRGRYEASLNAGIRCIHD